MCLAQQVQGGQLPLLPPPVCYGSAFRVVNTIKVRCIYVRAIILVFLGYNRIVCTTILR